MIPPADERIYNRARQDPDVQQQVHVLDVLHVVFELVSRREVVAATDLRDSREPWPHDQPLVESGHGFHKCGMQFWPLGPRTDQTHVSAKHVDYLRQFVQRGFPEDLPDTGYPRVIL
jgi:hypothetical protein